MKNKNIKYELIGALILGAIVYWILSVIFK